MMLNFSSLLTDLQAVIAAHAARNRALGVLLAALWGRIARMRTRLDRLVALWRAGKLPKPRAPRPAAARFDVPRDKPSVKFPTTPGWLRRRVGYEVGAFGSQLQHMLSADEAKAFLAACPQAGRILRPLLRMLTPDPLPAVVELPPKPVPLVANSVMPFAVATTPISQILDA